MNISLTEINISTRLQLCDELFKKYYLLLPLLLRFTACCWICTAHRFAQCNAIPLLVINSLNVNALGGVLLFTRENPSYEFLLGFKAIS